MTTMVAEKRRTTYAHTESASPYFFSRSSEIIGAMITPEMSAIRRWKDELRGGNERYEFIRSRLHCVCRLFGAGLIGRLNHASRNFGLASVGHPNHAYPQCRGSGNSPPIQHVGSHDPSMKYPAPFSGVSLTARRVISVPQSPACTSALRPSFFSKSSVNSDCACTIGWSVASMMTMRSPL